MNKQIFIIKASGDKVPFSEEKYRASLLHSGASQEEINTIVEQIWPQLFDGISTTHLYKITRRLLTKNKQQGIAGRYNLKQAMLKLGPSGYPFEKFFASLLHYQGYEVAVGHIVQGKCVSHEVDVVAIKGKERNIIECKFHQSGMLSSIQTSLYVKARYDDIQEASQHGYTSCWLVTNTRFSDVALQYGTCVKIKMLSWAYPIGQGLETIIDKSGLHPITCLSSLSNHDMQRLLHANVVLCSDLVKRPQIMKELSFKEIQVQKVLQEAHAVCSLEKI